MYTCLKSTIQTTVCLFLILLQMVENNQLLESSYTGLFFIRSQFSFYRGHGKDNHSQYTIKMNNFGSVSSLMWGHDKSKEGFHLVLKDVPHRWSLHLNEYFSNVCDETLNFLKNLYKLPDFNSQTRSNSDQWVT